jgi:hypothetical protein
MAGPRPGSERSTHTAWSLAPNDRGGILLWLVKWVAAAILAGAGIWGGVTWAIILRETEWRWIPVAIAIEAVIVAGAIVTPQTPAQDAARRGGSRIHDSQRGRLPTTTQVVLRL